MGEEAIVDAFLAKGATAGAVASDAAAAPVLADGANVQVDTPDVTKNPATKKKTTLKSAVGVAEKGQKAFGAAVPDVSDVPIPSGGVATLLIIALVIVFGVLTAPGQSVSRLRLLWGSLMGTYTLGDSSMSATTKAAEKGALQGAIPSLLPNNPYVQGSVLGPVGAWFGGVGQ